MPRPIDKGLAGPGLLAHVITNQFAYHLPLYRQEQTLAHLGATISRGTLCGWMTKSAELLAPLYHLMIQRVRSSRIIWTDDTTVPVWDPTLPKTRTGRFWVYLSDLLNPLCLRLLAASLARRPRAVPRRLRWLPPGRSVLGVDRLLAGSKVILVACWAHSRRKFYDTRRTDPRTAHQALVRIGQLYKIEDVCKTFTVQQHAAIRGRGAAPL